LELGEALRLEAPGGPGAARVARADHELPAAVLEDVRGGRAAGRGFGAGRAVGLQLAVAEAAAARVEGPLRRIGRGAARAVELVAPDERPLSAGRLRH